MDIEKQTQASESNSPATHPHAKKILSFLGAFLLLSLVGVAYFAHLLNTVNSREKQLQHDLERANTLIHQNTQSILALQNTFSNDINALSNTQDNLEGSVSQLSEKISLDENTWRLREAQELIRLAKLELVTTHHTQSALALLQAADHQIQVLNNPHLQDIRNAIAKDILALQNAATFDTSGVLAQINAVRDLLTQLNWAMDDNLALLSVSNEQPITSTTETNDTHSWRDRLKQSWAAIKQFMIIRKNESPVFTALSLEEKSGLVLILNLALLKADFGVLRSDNTLFNQGIDQATEVIKRYANLSNPETTTILNQLAALRKIRFDQALPSLENSWNAIDSLPKNH